MEVLEICFLLFQHSASVKNIILLTIHSFLRNLFSSICPSLFFICQQYTLIIHHHWWRKKLWLTCEPKIEFDRTVFLYGKALECRTFANSNTNSIFLCLKIGSLGKMEWFQTCVNFYRDLLVICLIGYVRDGKWTEYKRSHEMCQFHSSNVKINIISCRPNGL